MQHEDVVVAMERKCGWDTLLCADTHHCAVGLLAREMSCVSIPLCSRIARYLLRLLSTQEPRWELPSLAFLVEVLEFLNLSECGADRVLQILSRHLRSECKERGHLVLRALLELIKDPSMREKMWSLTESLVELLWDADGEIVSMTVLLLNFIILDKDMLTASPITLQLVEALLPLLDHVRLTAPSHGHWLLPRHFMTCGFAGLHKAEPHAANAEVSFSSLHTEQ
nr:uncharacterized protein LOC116806977 [Taeniopygia guttata]